MLRGVNVSHIILFISPVGVYNRDFITESTLRLSRPEALDYILGLFNCFFLDISGPKSYNLIQISYKKIQNKTTTMVVFTLSIHTYCPESHLLIHIQKLYISITYSERRSYCDEPLLVCRPSCMRKIADVLLYTYMD